jgi:hypothetical protein
MRPADYIYVLAHRGTELATLGALTLSLSSYGQGYFLIPELIFYCLVSLG